MAKPRTKNGGTGGQATAPPTPHDGAPRPIRESAPDPVALAAAAVVLAAIALAAWLALFRVH